MNTAYKTIWNAAIGAWVAVSEATCARGKRSTSRRAGRAARLVGPLLAATGFAMTLPAWGACAPAAPADGDVVSCTGVPILLPPNPNSFFSNANGLYVTVQPGAIMSTLPGGTAMTLGGTGVTLTNLSAIDANAAGSLVLARALAMGNLLTPGSGALAVNNEGSIEGTFDGTFSLNGAAMVIANQGKTTVNNAGAIGLAPLGLLTPANGMAIGIYGGGNVDFTNAKTGTITGRIAFEGAATGGNRFVNAGTINGSVSLGAGASSDTFIAVTGSSVSSGGVSFPGLAVPTPAGTSLGFAAGGTVDAGAGGTDTLTLRNVAFGPGSGNAGSGTIAASQYLNFENLQVDSGTWTLNGAVASGSALLYGGVAIFDDAGAFGTGTLTGNGGAIQAAVNGLTLAQNVNLTGGLFVQGANDLTLGGTVSGAAGLIKNGTGTLTLNGINNFSGGFALNGGGLTLGNASSLGTGLFLVGGNVALNTGFTGTLNNQVHLNGALTLDGTGTLTFGNAISGAGSLTVNGSNLALAASNTYGGGTTLGGGRLDVGSNTALGTGDLTINGASVLTGAAGVALANNVVLNSTLNFGAGGSGGALTLNGAISGAGGISLAGAPGVTLNGASTFTGGFNIGGGALTVGNDSALGLGSVTVSGASSLDSNKTVSLTNNLNLNAALTIGGSNDLALNGAIGGLRGLTKNGTGRLTLGSANTFFGGVNLQGGALRVGTNTSLGLGTLTVNGNAALDASANVNLGNAVVLNAGLDIGGANNIRLGGVITGTGPLSYSGSGTLTLANANFWTGGTTLKSGTLNVGNNFALGQGALAVTGNANLRANVPGTLLGNALTLGAGTTLNVDGSNPLALVGTIDGGGALALSGPGAVALAGANTYSGGTTVSGTTLGVINPTGSATGSGAVLVQAGGALTGNGSIAGTVSVGDGIVLPGNGSAGTLTVGGLNLASGSILNYDLGQAGVAGGALNDLISVNGNLQLDGTLNVSETAGGKFGAGLYRLIDYTGTLTDNGLNIGTAPTDSKNLQVQTSIANQVNLVNFDGATLNLWDGGNPANFNDGKIAGGSGTWRAGGSTASWTSVDGKLNAGWQQDGFAIFSGSAGTVTVDNESAGGAVRIGGAQFAVDGYVVNGDPLTISAANTTVRVGDGTAASAGMTATINAAIGGTGRLIKEEGGTLVLTGTNSYSGGTTVNGGILQISADANLGAYGTGLALDGGTLRIATGSAPFFSMRALSLGAGGGTIDLSNSLYGVGGPITGTGLLTITGKGGTFGLVAANSYSGGTLLKDGASITTTASGVLGSGAVQQQGNGTLLSLLGTASASSNEYTVGRAASTDSGNTLSFSQSATAAASKITLNGAGWQTPGANGLQFSGDSSAGASTIANAGGAINFFENASAGTATITNGNNSLVVFSQKSTAGGAQIANTAGGVVRFVDTATGTNASVTNAAGATFDVSGATGGKPAVELGSLSGAGAVVLGATQLSLGGLGNSDTISGTVSDKGSIFTPPGSGTGGSIVKVGAGTLTLSGANTYTGGTTIAAGTLNVNNASGSATGTGAVQILGNAMLAGNGSIAGTVSIAKGGILSAGNSPGTLTLGGLNLADGAVLNYELGQANTVGGPLNDLVKVNGNLQLDGTLNVAQSAGGTFGAGLYRLISYTGGLTDNGLDIGIAPGAVSDLQVQTSVAQQVNLVNRAGLSLNFWDGGDSTKYNDGQVAGGSGTWRVGTPGDGWTGIDGKINAAWAQGQFAVFGGKAGTVSVDGLGGRVLITGAQFATDGYRVQGDAIELANAATTVRVGDGTAAGAGMTATIASELTGTGGVVKEDLGTLVLDGINSYSGGTLVKAGILQIASDANLGTAAGGLALEGGATLRVTGDTASTRVVSLGAGVDTFDIDPIRTLALNGVVTGAGSLRKTGAGILQLGAANFYAGGTEVAAGSLEALVTGALGAGPVSVADNASLAFANSAEAGKLAITVAARGGAPTDNGGFVAFRDSSSAGNATITTNKGAAVEFRDTSSAGNAVIENRGGLTTLWFNASAGKAQITNFDGGRIDLLDDASAGQARLVNESGGAISFFDRTNADQATVVNNGGAQLGIGSLTNAGLSIGSLEGAGSVLLGAKALTTGGLNTSTTVSGTISGTGGSVVKVGSGTLTLSGANTYTGGTTVAAGTLAANNASGSATGTGAVQVQGGATLAGTGAVAGTVTIAKGGILSAGNGGAGTLTTGSLNLAAGAVLDYDLGQAGTAGGALNDLVKVNGNLQLDGTLNVAQSKGGLFGAGIYRLIDYTGTLIDNGLDIGSAPVASKDLQVQTSVAQQVNLVNRAGLVLNFWDGGDAGKYNDGKIAGGSGTWRVGVPGDGWTGADGKINAAWVQDQFAVFGGTGGTVNVSNAGGTVRITGAQFAADGYVLQGDAIELGASGTVVRVGDGSGTDTTRSATLNVALIGTGGLVKEDVGTLVLGGTNTYTGGTTVKAGVLQGGTASLQGAIVNNAEVAFDQGTTAGTYAGTMSGTGKLRKIGSGTLVLGSANSHAGGTFVDAGTLATDVTGALGSGAANVATGATLQLGGGFDAGTTAIGNQGTVRLQDKSSAGASTITNAAGGVLDFAGDASADKATVINQAGAQVRIDQATTGVSFGALSGAGETVLGAKALTLGASGGDNTLSGSISGAGGSVVKVGAGTLVLTGANTYTGATTVAAGTLRVNNTSGSGTGTGAVQVQSGATLAGSGSIAGAVTIAKGGILAAGNSPGTLTLGALTLAGGSTLNYELGQAGVPGGALNDLINVTGNLQLDGTLNIAQSAGGTFGPGLYRLMSYGGTFTDNGLDIGTAPAGAKLADLQVQTSVANQVNLVNRAGLSLNFWDGGDSSKYNDGQVAGGNGTWRVGSPQPSQDGWTDMDGKLNANWAQNQFAVFGGKAGTVTVDGGGGAVRIAGAQFAVDGYTVQGDGITLDNANSVIRVGDGTAAGANMTATMNVALSGTGGISKEDAGRLILGGANTYTGGTTVKGGVLQGSATSLQGNITNNAEVAFDQDKTAGIYAGAMSGTGKLRKIGAGTLTLASANNYSGGTLVDAGTLATDTSGALGTGAVSIASGAALQFGGKADAGKLAIANQGTLRLQDGANAASATVTNAAGAQVRIDLATTGASIGALGGAGDVVLGAKALTTGAIGSDSTISGAITGAGGSLVKVGAGTLTLAGTASYSGETRVAAGTLKAGAANAFSAASSAVVASGATLNLAGFSQTVAGLANSGTVALAGATPGTTLTVKGNYVGNNGVLKLGTVLNGGAGPSDRLVIDGGVASGKTSVQIANIGGLGARTSGAGIEVVSARNGATTTAQTTKDAFVLAGGHVDAGAFEYRLHAGDASGGGENWYLRTEAEPGTPGNPGGTGLPAYRAEASLFAALPNQLRQSNLGMLASRSQRVGDDDVRGGAGSTSSSTDGSYRRAWGRLISTDMDIRQGGTVSPHSEGRVTGLQAGTDLWANPDWRAGIYVGQLDGDTRVRGVGSGLLNSATGRNDLRSQYLGLYGTFATEDGFYADAVLQAGRHRHTVQPLLSGGVEGKGNSFLASIEVGKAFAIGSGGWSVEPQLQLIHQRLRLDDVSIPGALVQQDADSGWIGRAGVRIKGSFATGAGTLQPYARVNVYRSAKGNDVARFVNPAAITPVGAPIGGTSTELAAGFTLSVSQRTSLYGELGKQWASGGDARVGSSINAAAGVRVKW
ncbi:autotransporter-associated beta strand protein [Variovorax boronicumulans]|uniref:autotransporter-associated beta strand repeat-containing protein n=1 Tax=Variovorax boronicumulans TaxID=436515 RepID=UPI0027811828|nr:autotransporter-associated beta strand repeat-containing protein [Variovorax boronicumulans]MDQ0032879.1 autotransporter-associated beta strand protein [Variovorax boronicumulans]